MRAVDPADAVGEAGGGQREGESAWWARQISRVCCEVSVSASGGAITRMATLLGVTR